MKIINELVDKISRFPGIGGKRARRIAYHILNQPDYYSQEFGKLLLSLKDTVKICNVCCNYSMTETCDICNSKRNQDILCLVAYPKDVDNIENTKSFDGYYHVLHGLISIPDGITPKHIRIIELLKRLQQNDNIKEIIIAFDSGFEASNTAEYIKQILPPDYKLTRLASGLSFGAELEYADEKTLAISLKERKEVC